MRRGPRLDVEPAWPAGGASPSHIASSGRDGGAAGRTLRRRSRSSQSSVQRWRSPPRPCPGHRAEASGAAHRGHAAGSTSRPLQTPLSAWWTRTRSWTSVGCTAPMLAIVVLYGRQHRAGRHRVGLGDVRLLAPRHDERCEHRHREVERAVARPVLLPAPVGLHPPSQAREPPARPDLRRDRADARRAIRDAQARRSLRSVLRSRKRCALGRPARRHDRPDHLAATDRTPEARVVAAGAVVAKHQPLVSAERDHLHLGRLPVRVRLVEEAAAGRGARPSRARRALRPVADEDATVEVADRLARQPDEALDEGHAGDVRAGHGSSPLPLGWKTITSPRFGAP